MITMNALYRNELQNDRDQETFVQQKQQQKLYAVNQTIYNEHNSKNNT